MAEKHLVALAQSVFIWFSVLCLVEAVFGALATAEEIICATFALHGKRLAFVAPEGTMLFVAVHFYKRTLLDISQTILSDVFTMMMLVDVEKSTVEFTQLSKELDSVGKELGLEIRIQLEEIFQAMHRI